MATMGDVALSSMFSFRTLGLLAGLCLFSLPAHADLPVPVAHASWTQARSDLPVDPEAHYGVLPNGLRYVIYRNSTKARATAIRFQIAAGSMQESDSQRGLAHFVEHMAFKGSTNIAEGELTKILAREGFQFGTDVNAFTDYEKTDYVLNLPGNDDATIDTAMFILREIAGNLTFNADAIERERGVVLSEERMRASPSGRADQAAIEATYAGQLYPNRNPIGLIDTIKTAPRQALVDYYQDFYRPDDAILVVVGDFDVDRMEQRITKVFGDWKPARPGPLKMSDYGARQVHDVTAAVHADPSMVDTETVTWVRPFLTTSDTLTTRTRGMAKYMATQILNVRYRRLAADPKAPYLSAQLVYDNQHLQANTTVLTVIPKPGQEKEAFSAALKVLLQFRDLGALPDEVKDFIDQGDAQMTNYLRTYRTRFSSDIADEIMQDIDEDSVLQSATQYADLWDKMKPGMTPELVNAQARAILSGDGPVLIRDGGDAAVFDADAMKAAYADALAAPREAWNPASVQAWPYTDFGPAQTPVSEERDDNLDYRHYRFANGVTANIKTNPLIKNQIIVSVHFGGGYELFSPSEKISLMQTQLYDPTDGGLSRISRDDLIKAMASKTISANFTLAEDYAALTGYTTPDSFEAEMQVLMAYATDQAYDTDAFANFKSSLNYMYGSMMTSPETVEAINESLYMKAGDPRYAFPTREQAEAIDPASLAALYRRTMSGVPVEVTITGDISTSEALEQVAKTFANLPAVPDRFTPAPGGAEVALPADRTPQVWYHDGRGDQAAAAVAFPTTGALGDIHTARGLDLLAAILNDRLTEDLRERQGATYDMSVQSYASQAFGNYGYLEAACTLKPGVDQAFVDAVLRAAADIRDHGVTPDELDRARKPMIELLSDSAKNNEDWQDTIAGLYGHPDRRAYRLGVTRTYLSITANDIQQLARTYLKPDAMLRMIAVPRPKP